MTRTLNNAVYRALLSRESDDGELVLLTITPPVGEVIRVARNSADVTSRGQVFLGYPFSLSILKDSPDAAPTAGLQIGNVDRRITDALQTLTAAPSFKIELALFSDPDTIWYTVSGLKLQDWTADAMTVSGPLIVERFASEPWPGLYVTPAFSPTLYT